MSYSKISFVGFPTLIAGLIAGFGLSFPAFAQDSTAPVTDPAPAETPAITPEEPVAVPAAPADPLSLGTTEAGTPNTAAPTDGPGSVYLAKKEGEWELRCLRAEDGSDPCQLYQLLKDGDGNSVAEISMFALPPGGPAVVGATFAAPLETLLTEQLRIQVDQNTAKLYPFTWCEQTGCIARIGLTAEEIAAFKKGAAASATIVPAVAPDQKVVLSMSLVGFTATYDALLASLPPAAN